MRLSFGLNAELLNGFSIGGVIACVKNMEHMPWEQNLVVHIEFTAESGYKCIISADSVPKGKFDGHLLRVVID